MPPKASANKIATAMAAVNRAVVRNVAAVNKTVVKNYNAANRAINRAPAWVKWTIAAIAVAIIGYALWKVFFAGKKEGFYETDSTKIKWVKQDKSKLTTDAMTNYNILNFKDNNVSHSPFDEGNSTTHVDGVIDLERSTGKDSVFYGDMTVEAANYWCGRSKLCGGWQGEMINGLYNVRFLGRELQLSSGNIVASDVHVIFKKELIQPEAVVAGGETAVTDPGYGTTFYSDIANEMIWSEHSLMITDNVTKDACKAKVVANKSARGGSWVPNSATDPNGRCREISWECLVNRENGTSIKDSNKKCITMDAPRRSRVDNAVTWVKSNAGDVLAKRTSLPDIPMPKYEAEPEQEVLGVREEFDAKKDTFSLNKEYFEKDQGNMANYILSGRDVRFADAMSVSVYKPYEDTPKSFESCFTAFNSSQNSVMIYRNDGHCWFKNPADSSKFIGASLVPSTFNGVTYTTIIRKSLGFTTESDVINKAAEKPAQSEVEPSNMAYGIHVHMPRAQKINTESDGRPITLKECVTKGFYPTGSQAMIAHDAGSQIGIDKAYNCWWANFDDKNSLADAVAKDPESGKTDTVRTYTDRNPKADLSTASAFNTWVGKNRTFNIATDYFFIKTPDGKYVGRKSNFFDKLYIGDKIYKQNHSEGTYAFKFENEILKAYTLWDDNHLIGETIYSGRGGLVNTESSVEIKLRQDALTIGSTVVNSYVLVDNKGDDSIKTFKFEPKGNDTYHIFAGRSGDASVPVSEATTADPPVRFIGAYGGRPSTLFTLERVLPFDNY